MSIFNIPTSIAEAAQVWVSQYAVGSPVPAVFEAGGLPDGWRHVAGLTGGSTISQGGVRAEHLVRTSMGWGVVARWDPLMHSPDAARSMTVGPLDGPERAGEPVARPGTDAKVSAAVLVHALTLGDLMSGLHRLGGSGSGGSLAAGLRTVVLAYLPEGSDAGRAERLLLGLNPHHVPPVAFTDLPVLEPGALPLVNGFLVDLDEGSSDT